MKKLISFALVALITISLYNICFAAQKTYKLVTYRPLSQSECLKNKKSIGAKLLSI